MAAHKNSGTKMTQPSGKSLDDPNLKSRFVPFDQMSIVAKLAIIFLFLIGQNKQTLIILGFWNVSSSSLTYTYFETTWQNNILCSSSMYLAPRTVSSRHLSYWLSKWIRYPCKSIKSHSVSMYFHYSYIGMQTSFLTHSKARE